MAAIHGQMLQCHSLELTLWGILRLLSYNIKGALIITQPLPLLVKSKQCIVIAQICVRKSF